MNIVRKACLFLSVLGVLILLVGLALGKPAIWQPAAVTTAVGLAFGLGAVPGLKSYQYTLWIVAAVTAAMIYPDRFLSIGPLPALHLAKINLRDPWIVLTVIQLVMFGMGTQMSLRDFVGVMKMPRGVLVGIVCHFTIMPLVGLALTKIFHFPPEIAAGIILIGSCSSGLASNVMAYIAKANLGLSVTVTAVTTMVAPFLTPMWMKLLTDNKEVPVSYVGMMMEIIEIVLVPIGAALLHDYLKHASSRGRSIVWGLAAAGVAWLAFILLGGWAMVLAKWPSTTAANGKTVLDIHATLISAFGFLMGAPIIGVLYHELTKLLRGLDSRMPLFSMFGIVYFTAVTTAAGRDDLLKIGGLLFLAAILHNLAGYFFGYWLSRASGLDKNSSRSVAFEVGMQNGGMASGLAGAMGKLGTVGLAAAIFSPWMNVSGSVLANYWRKRPTDETPSS